MPSHFPGMDPFLEGEEWEDFHTRFNTAISEVLSQQIEPRYVVRIERRVYVEHTIDETTQLRRADIAVLTTDNDAVRETVADNTMAASRPSVECLLPMPEEVQETYLVVRERQSRVVVTILETLSPGNKRSGSDGRREYLAKRDEILRSNTHSIEFDLLRGGLRLPMRSPLPPGDYYAIVSRSQQRPRSEVFAWTIRDALPTILVPLRPEDPEVPLDLQAVFASVSDHARYDLSIDYDRPLQPQLEQPDRRWATERLATERRK